MICGNCKSENYEVFYTETYPCGHCGEDMIIEFCFCADCGMMWRAIDGNALEDSIIDSSELFNIFNPASDIVGMSPDDLRLENKELFEKIQEELNKYERLDHGSATMSDMIHKCLQCGAIVHESTPGNFECEECGFSWEVINLG